MSKFRTTIQPADRNPEIAVVVEYHYHKADDGGREYPSSPAYIEIESITHGGINLTDYLADHILIDIEQEIEADITAAQEAAMERHDEQMREMRAEYLAEAKRDLSDARNIEYWEKYE